MFSWSHISSSPRSTHTKNSSVPSRAIEKIVEVRKRKKMIQMDWQGQKSENGNPKKGTAHVSRHKGNHS